MAIADTRTYRMLGWLLTYPESAWLDRLPELMVAIAAEKLLDRQRFAELRAFAERLGQRDPIEAQEEYVGLFDRSRRVSLHLFEHVHGESRDRGMAMVNLREIYAAAGLVADPDELPDFLPMYLEYLSLLPRDQAQRSLADVGPVLQAIHARLEERDSAYRKVFACLLDLAGLKVERIEGAAADDDSPEAVDRMWEETAVIFGPAGDPQAGGGCDVAESMVARMKKLDTDGQEART